MSISSTARPRVAAAPDALPSNIFRYAFVTSGMHQLVILALSVSASLLEVAPLELQRRIVNDIVKDRPYRWVIVLCLVYVGVVLIQGGTKLVLNVYRGWVGERAIRDLRRRIHMVVDTPTASSQAAQEQGIAVSMIVAEVEPIGGFVGGSVSEPLLQGGILASVLAYLVHLDPWMALVALALFIPQFLFVLPMQGPARAWRGRRLHLRARQAHRPVGQSRQLLSRHQRQSGQICPVGQRGKLVLVPRGGRELQTVIAAVAEPDVPGRGPKHATGSTLGNR
jgi:ABC-type multidrug transport system fused ATPase/permease subunit